jgi:hypothetical protein
MSKEQFNIRLTPEVKAQLKALAEQDNRTEGQEVEALIKAEVKRRKRRQK